jgi:alkylation response protein AidB-like acyl-CoA dehydrogenase
MYLVPEGDELEVANAAAAFLGSAMGIERLHKAGSADMDAATRQSFGDMGWFALAVPEADGGSGLSAIEHALFFREAGRQCAPVDLLAQCLAANVTSDSTRRAAIMAGEAGVALIVADSDQFRLLGSTDAAWGLAATSEGASLYALGDLQTSSRDALDPANSMRTLAALPALAESRADRHVWQLGQLGTAAMLVGIAEAALDLIVEYAKVRETFGRKIGAYQAVRHSCADMALRVEAARSQLYYAATALKEKHGDAEAHLDAAKHVANQAALANADANIQLHGGIGVTDEHDSHLLLKHAMLLSRLFGSKRALLSRLLNARLSD